MINTDEKTLDAVVSEVKFVKTEELTLPCLKKYNPNVKFSYDNEWEHYTLTIKTVKIGDKQYKLAVSKKGILLPSLYDKSPRKIAMDEVKNLPEQELKDLDKWGRIISNAKDGGTLELQPHWNALMNGYYVNILRNLEIL
ncbi:Uncharacterised protein [Candidatus Tiddalikarchaeum anstoanum]|nr:Uncharacterised protein [Candidatus Tiddalikarchaeum anstoanum]